MESPGNLNINIFVMDTPALMPHVVCINLHLSPPVMSVSDVGGDWKECGIPHYWLVIGIIIIIATCI